MKSFPPDNTNPDGPQNSMQSEEPVMNIARADDLAQTVGPEVFAHVTKLFVDQATNSLKEIHQAVRAQSYDDIANLSHSLKGSAYTVGCDLLAELYGRIELAAKNAESDKVDQLTAQLQDATQKSLSALSDRL